MEIENPMVNDSYWIWYGKHYSQNEEELEEEWDEEEDDDEEDDYEWLERIEEEEEKERKLPLFVYSRINDGYHF